MHLSLLCRTELGMRTREIIDVAMKAGEILILSGAEVYRVEDTLARIFKSYDVEAECFVLLSGIFITAKGEDDEVISVVKRIKGHINDLQKIEKVNSFSRSLMVKAVSYEEAMEILNAIESTPRYRFSTRLAASGVAAFVYSLLFKSSVKEAVAALLISLMVFTVKENISRVGFFQFFEYFVSGMISGAMSIFAVKLFPEMNLYKIIIGSIMILVPGVAMTNGIKDALYGDTVSSIYRLAEAVFIAVAVASGVGIMLSIGIRWV